MWFGSFWRVFANTGNVDVCDHADTFVLATDNYEYGMVEENGVCY